MAAVDPGNTIVEAAKQSPQIEVADFSDFMESLPKGSVDLILTDPPYTISKETGFKSVVNGVQRFAVSMDFGTWDHCQIDLLDMAQVFYRALRQGGTAIVWYDLWKIGEIKEAMEQAGFKMLRQIIWEKTNPVPLNMRATYLSNAREMAVSGVKGGKPTFHSEYDSGIYLYEHETGVYKRPIPRHNGNRQHPTQKPEDLFSELVLKHSNPGDMVVDPFLGAGTTAMAALKNGRAFAGCDIDEHYVSISRRRLTMASEKAKPKFKSGSKPALFLELAQPDELGFSNPIPVTEFVGKYEGLTFGNGGSWTRKTGSLAKVFNIRRHPEGTGTITHVELQGFTKTVTQKPIPENIRQEVIKQRCVILATGSPQCDHKDGRLDDPRLSDISQVTIDDFQPLSRAVNDAKRQHCQECRTTGNRFDARRLGYSVSQVRGDGKYNGTCVGCYWHDPPFFNSEVSRNYQA